MNLNIRYPSVSDGTTEEQLGELRSYLYQMVETLNACDISALALMSELSQAVNASELPDAAKRPETELKLQEYSALRSLIIKTADYAVTNSQSFRLSLSGNYVAVSDFGKYFEEATVDINGTPYGIMQLYNYSAGIDAENTDYRVQQESYIKSGLLYYDSNSLPVYGVGVGNIYGDFFVYGLTQDETINNAKTYYTKSGDTYTEVDEPKQSELSTYYERVMSRQTGQLSSTFTAEEIAFWSGSTKLAYMNTSAVYFPNANITGGSIQIGGTDDSPAFSVNSSGYMKSTSGKIANWNIGTDSIYTDGATYDNTTGSYFGNSGLRIGAYLKATATGKLTATNAELSGKITADSGSIGGWTIGTNQLYSGNVYLNASTGTISGAYISGGTVYGATISGGTMSGTTGSFGGNLSGSTITVGGGYGTLYAGTNTAGTTAFEVYGPYGLRLVSAGNVYAACGGSAFITISGSNVTVGDNLYLSSGTQITSDRNKKNSISYDLSALEPVFDALKPSIFKYNDGTSDRYHGGFIAQDWEEAILNAGLTSKDYAVYCKVPVYKLDEDGNPTEEIEGYTYALRYDEIIPLNTYEIQKLKARVYALEQMIGG